jgi:hypothetical protein
MWKRRWQDQKRQWNELPIERKLAVAIVPLLVAIITVVVPILADGNGGGATPTAARNPSPAEPAGGDPEGRILSPRRGRLSRTFTVQGSLSDIPRDRHVWLAVQIGNLLTPKEPEIPSQDRRWAVDVVEGGRRPGERFGLALLMVDVVGQREIERWRRRGRRSGSFPPFERIQGSAKLDVVPPRLVLR